jgi:hypothetical protein
MGQTEIATQSGATATLAGETLFLAELACEGRTFVFNRPLPVQVLQEEGGCSVESEDYRLMAHGDTRAEAESSFRHVFAYCWDQIACEDDERLTKGAIRMKRDLLSLVREQK